MLAGRSPENLRSLLRVPPFIVIFLRDGKESGARGASDMCLKGNHMAAPEVNSDECSGCGICVDACPESVLDIIGDAVAVVNEDACVECGECVEECPMGALALED